MPPTLPQRTPLKRARARVSRWFNTPHPILQRQFPQVLWSGDPTHPKIALSYDDGPDRKDTPQLLDVLARHNVTVTFSWLGARVAAMPSLVQEAAAAGHQIMVHGYRHRAFVLERARVLRGHLDATRDLIATTTGRDPGEVVDVRPPFGLFTPRLLRRLAGWGYRPVIGSFVPVHWLQPDEVSLRQILGHTRPGALFVLHEGLGGPPIADLTDAVLTRLADRGYDYITVDEMWRQQGGGNT